MKLLKIATMLKGFLPVLCTRLYTFLSLNHGCKGGTVPWCDGYLSLEAEYSISGDYVQARILLLITEWAYTRRLIPNTGD